MNGLVQSLIFVLSLAFLFLSINIKENKGNNGRPKIFLYCIVMFLLLILLMFF